MTLERIDPDRLARPETYTHVVVAAGSRLVFIAGQSPRMRTATSSVVMTSRPKPPRHSSNLGRALAAAGASPEDVARLGIYVVALREDHLPAIEAARVALFANHKPVDTLLGVETLAHPGCLLEVDAIAVIGG
jgi:enamine deaminase RidA (YjgF/YER057c/UK114 family)